MIRKREGLVTARSRLDDGGVRHDPKALFGCNNEKSGRVAMDYLPDVTTMFIIEPFRRKL